MRVCADVHCCLLASSAAALIAMFRLHNKHELLGFKLAQYTGKILQGSAWPWLSVCAAIKMDYNTIFVSLQFCSLSAKSKQKRPLGDLSCCQLSVRVPGAL
jgi:hypothetical protein